MSRSAVLLMDLQQDFLGKEDARMPVDKLAGASVLRCANAVLSKRALPDALPIMVVNQFARGERIAKFYRAGAAIKGTPGAQLDKRLQLPGQVKIIAKTAKSAFSNPDLEHYLIDQDVADLFVLGVFAQACVHATVIDALRLGYRVTVIVDGVASDKAWKARLALWRMQRAGATLLPSLGVAPY